MAPSPDRSRWRPFGRLGALVTVFAAVGTGCPGGDSGGRAADAAAPDAGSLEAAAIPEIPYDGRLRVVAARSEHDGETVDLDTDAFLELPDGATLYLETWQRLEDHRVRLTTGTDRLVPFTLESGPVAARETGGRVEPGGTWIRLRPTAELRPGVEYQVRIESEIGDRITDVQARVYEDLLLTLRRAEPRPEDDRPADVSPEPPTEAAR